MYIQICACSVYPFCPICAWSSICTLMTVGIWGQKAWGTETNPTGIVRMLKALNNGRHGGASLSKKCRAVFKYWSSVFFSSVLKSPLLAAHLKINFVYMSLYHFFTTEYSHMVPDKLFVCTELPRANISVTLLHFRACQCNYRLRLMAADPVTQWFNDSLCTFRNSTTKHVCGIEEMIKKTDSRYFKRHSSLLKQKNKAYTSVPWNSHLALLLCLHARYKLRGSEI